MLAVPLTRRAGRVLLHALPCARVPIPLDPPAHGLREVVWSTTYYEIDDYASRTYGEQGWSRCPGCRVSDAD